MFDDGSLYHVTFVTPVRVMLMDKSTPLAAVTGTLKAETGEGRSQIVVLILCCKMLFPTNGGPVKSSMQLITAPHNIAGAVEVKTP